MEAIAHFTIKPTIDQNGILMSMTFTESSSGKATVTFCRTGGGGLKGLGGSQSAFATWGSLFITFA